MAIYRYRVGRLIELERVRTRIATDLHDDIGASLSLIAMLSEVAQRQVQRGSSSVAEPSVCHRLIFARAGRRYE